MNPPMNHPTMDGARIRSYRHDDLTFDVLDEGPIDGDVVVLLHGFPERATCWRHVAPLLHAQGYRTLAPDQRGYSLGARPPRRRDYASARLVDDVAALIDLVGGSAHVVGHDWGAIVAWALTLAHPAKVRTLTAVSGPHPQAFLASLFTSRQGLKSWYMLVFNVPRLPERLAAKPGGVFDTMLRRSGMSRDDVARMRHEIIDDGALPGGLGYYRGLPFIDRTTARSSVVVPTTMIWSDGDDFLARAGVDRTERYVEAPYELVVLRGVNHWIPVQAPQACAEAILERIASV